MRRRSFRFSTQVLLFEIGVLVLVCGAGLGLIALVLRQDLISEYQQRALGIARSVAADERYAGDIESGDPEHRVQARAETVRARTGALFVVVTDRHGVRYSHPEPAVLGTPVNPAEPQALDGREVTFFGASQVGRSARAKVPLRDGSGAVAGEVIVAISAQEIDHTLLDLVGKAALFVGIALAGGAAGATALTRRVKRQTLGLEPGGLRLLWEQQAALRRVATLVAEGASPPAVFDAVVAEVQRVLHSTTTALLRYQPDAAVVLLAGNPGLTEELPVGTRVAPERQKVAAAVRRTGAPTRIDRSDDVDDPGTWSWPPDARCVVGAPIVVEGRLWGLIVAGWNRAGPPPDTEEQLADFTELIATAVSNAESRAELTASRARVVAATDETRRRIERDLHDGIQQRLVSFALELRTLEATAPAGALADQLAELGQAVTGAIADLQEISRGIHPAILSRGGLAPALRTLARRSAVPVRLDSTLPAARRLPEPVEVAAYYAVSEALTNAAKHAGASVVEIDLGVDDRGLALTIADDGVGGADPARGSGLVGLRDRIAALGGTIDVTSPAGAGTTLVVRIPVDPG